MQVQHLKTEGPGKDDWCSHPCQVTCSQLCSGWQFSRTLCSLMLFSGSFNVHFDDEGMSFWGLVLLLTPWWSLPRWKLLFAAFLMEEMGRGGFYVLPSLSLMPQELRSLLELWLGCCSWCFSWEWNLYLLLLCSWGGEWKRASGRANFQANLEIQLGGYRKSVSQRGKKMYTSTRGKFWKNPDCTSKHWWLWYLWALRLSSCATFCCHAELILLWVAGVICVWDLCWKHCW